MDDWRTSTRSNPNGECVEAASGVRVRDTKDRSGPVLEFSPGAWRVFTARLKQLGCSHYPGQAVQKAGQEVSTMGKHGKPGKPDQGSGGTGTREKPPAGGKGK